ncbi:porin [Kushneria aurantia]|uniref:Porin n=1 Tax=Kushneria aurantia TaxID=504092 RepID=A0ABV6FZQ1_9GAMM|nr:porin [Kushneria aurantia]
MKKTILATAIAGALGTVAMGAQAATVYNQDGTKLDVYGNVQIGVGSFKTDIQDDGSVDSESDIFDNGSTVGFRGEHVISPSLTGYFRAEFEYDADEAKNSNGLGNGDQAFLGLTGDFGDARVGSWDPLLDDWIEDPVSNNEYFDLNDAGGQASDSNFKEGNKVAYTSPILNGLQFSVGTQYYGDGEDQITVIDSLGGAGSVTTPSDSNASFFGGLRYMVGGWTFAAVYDNLKNYKYVDSTGDESDFGKQYGVNANWEATDNVRVSAKWERFDGDFASNDNVDYYGIGTRIGYGYGDVYGAYQYVDAEENAVILTSDTLVTTNGDESYNQFVLGGTYNLSSQMYVWLEGGVYDLTEDYNDGVATGVTYSF